MLLEDSIKLSEKKSLLLQDKNNENIKIFILEQTSNPTYQIPKAELTHALI